MKFSITIPTYKSKFLQEAIESVVSQTYEDWELIIVDDCSPENIKSIVAPYLSDKRIQYYRNEKNCGAENVVNNWNICLSYCTGDYVICIGDDDRLLPNCLEELIKVSSKFPGLNVYHIQTEIIDEKGQLKETLEERPERESAIRMMMRRWHGQQQFIGDFCYKREHLIACGGYFFLPYAWGSDDITAFRAAMEKGIANTITPGFQYRVNDYSISLSHYEEKKVDAVIKHEEWFCQVLQTIGEKEDYPHEEIKEAIKSMHAFMKQLKCYHIQNDMQHKGIMRYFFWCSKTSQHGLSIFILTKLLVKSIIM